MSKTNFDYVRDFLKGNEEAMEFLDAAENDYRVVVNMINENGEYAKKQEEENENLLLRISRLEEEPIYPNEIITPSGNIGWNADNLQLIAIMESLEEKLKTTSPVEIARILGFNKVSDPVQ